MGSPATGSDGGQGGNRTPTVERRLIYSQRSSPPAQPTHGNRRRVVHRRRGRRISEAPPALNRRLVSWSRGWESNPQPSVYKTDALPLSYLGAPSPSIAELL